MMIFAMIDVTAGMKCCVLSLVLGPSGKVQATLQCIQYSPDVLEQLDSNMDNVRWSIDKTLELPSFTLKNWPSQLTKNRMLLYHLSEIFIYRKLAEKTT